MTSDNGCTCHYHTSVSEDEGGRNVNDGKSQMNIIESCLISSHGILIDVCGSVLQGIM